MVLIFDRKFIILLLVKLNIEFRKHSYDMDRLGNKNLQYQYVGLISIVAISLLIYSTQILNGANKFINKA